MWIGIWRRWICFGQKTCLFCPLLEFWVKLGRTLLLLCIFPLIFILGVFSQSGIRERTQSGGRSMDYTEKQNPDVTDDRKILFSLNHSKTNLPKKVSWLEAAKQWWHAYPTLRRFSSTKNSKINVYDFTLTFCETVHLYLVFWKHPNMISGYPK